MKIFAAIMILFISLYCYTLYRVMQPCENYVNIKVLKVGGCDQAGRCGVTYADGSTGIERYPIVDEIVRKCLR